MQFTTQSEEINVATGMKEQLQTTAQNPCNALNMTKVFPVGDRNIGCKMKNDDMQISYFVINHTLMFRLIKRLLIMHI